MKCQNCNERDASVHIKKIINGVSDEKFYCNECAQKQNELNFYNPFDTSKIFTSLFGTGYTPKIMEEKVCPTCKSNFLRFKNLGLLGCNDCYETFEKDIRPIIERVQPALSHKGKIPTQLDYDTQKNIEISRLRADLNQAIEDENYELAAKLRDDIRQKEGGM